MIRSQTWLSRALALSVSTMLIAACGGTNPTTAPPTTQGRARRGRAATAAPTAATGSPEGRHDLPAVGRRQLGRRRPAARLHRRGCRVLRRHDLPVRWCRTSTRPIRSRARRSRATSRPIPEPPADGGKTWSFTLRDGVTWQDGSPAHLRRRRVRRLAPVRDRHHGWRSDLRHPVPRHPAQGGRSSQYPGPYKATAEQQALFDKAVACDGQQDHVPPQSSRGDFAYSTLLGRVPGPGSQGSPGDAGHRRGLRDHHPTVGERPVQGRELHAGQGRHDGARPQ